MRWIVGIVIAVAFLPSVAGLITPEVTFIPEKISANAPFIAIIEESPGESVRPTWIVPGIGEAYFGSFPKVGDRHICYFSNTDPQATCGPSPFPFPTIGFSPYQVLMNSINGDGELQNYTFPKDVGSLGMDVEINVNDSIAYVIISPQGGLPDTIEFAVYHDNLSVYNEFEPLTKDIQTGYYLGNIPLVGGEYFFIFQSESSDNWGSSIERVSLPIASGHDGGECLETPNATADLPIVIAPVEPIVLLPPGGTYKKEGNAMTNLGDVLIENLVATVPVAFSNILTITLVTTTLDVNDTGLFTVELANIDSSMQITTLVDIHSGTELVGQIPVNIPVTITGDGGSGPTCTSGGSFTLSPNVWSGDYVIGETAALSITMTNAQDTAISSITHSTTGNLDGTTTVTLPFSVPASSFSFIDVELDPLVSGNYQGSIIIESDAGSEHVLVNLNFFDDLSGQLAIIEADFNDVKTLLTTEQLLLLGDTLDNIDAALAAADLDIQAGNYKDAEKSFVEAQAQIDALSELSTVPATPPTTTTPPSGGGGDFTPIIAGVFILIIIIVVVVIIKKRRSGGGGAEDDELDDELSQEFEEGSA